MSLTLFDLTSFAASEGLGSALSGPVAARFLELAQAVRGFATETATEIRALQERSAECSRALRGCRDEHWQGPAASAYEHQLETAEHRQSAVTDGFTEAAVLVTSAGEALAAEIEQRAASVAAAGAAVDRAVSTLAHTDLADLTEVLQDSAVRVAQNQLLALADDSQLQALADQLGVGVLS